jgi:hypothetical protein
MIETLYYNRIVHWSVHCNNTVLKQSDYKLTVTIHETS